MQVLYTGPMFQVHIAGPDLHPPLHSSPDAAAAPVISRLDALRHDSGRGSESGLGSAPLIHMPILARPCRFRRRFAAPPRPAGVQHDPPALSGRGVRRVPGRRLPLPHHHHRALLRRRQDRPRHPAAAGPGALPRPGGPARAARRLLQGGRQRVRGVHGVRLHEHHVQQGNGPRVLRRQGGGDQAHGALSSHCLSSQCPLCFRRRAGTGSTALRRNTPDPRREAHRSSKRWRRAPPCPKAPLYCVRRCASSDRGAQNRCTDARSH